MSAKILFIDIETAPILAWVWKIWDESIGLNQISQDSHLLSFSAKWLGEKKVMYHDQRSAKAIEDDSSLLRKIWPLLNSADIVIGHNSKQFDTKVINTRFIMHGMKPPSSYKQIDTLDIAKKTFRFTSNKLEHLSNKLCDKYKKLKHAKYSGFELWKGCLSGDINAWKEMEKYNKMDVLSLEELYLKMQPWDNGYNPDLYTNDEVRTCACGSTNLIKYGYRLTSAGRYQRYKCQDCGAERIHRKNLFAKKKRDSLLS